MARKSKLPDASVIRQHLHSGIDRHALAARYDVTADYVADKLAMLGLLDLEHAIHHPKQEAPAEEPAEPGIKIMPGKLVFTRICTAGEWGGIAYRRISLPLISCHLAALREARQC